MPAPVLEATLIEEHEAPAVRVRYTSAAGRSQIAWLVAACPFCNKPHRHSGKVAPNALVNAGCNAKRHYRLAYAEVVR